MRMRRRDFFSVGLGGAAAFLIAPRAGATGWRRAPMQGLASLLFSLVWEAVEPTAVTVIKSLLSQACANVGRSFGVDSENTTQGQINGGTTKAVINLSVRKHPDGLRVDAYMPDGNGGHAFTHSGTAPSHTHPQMQAHMQAIVGKAHAWLGARGQ
jgi:hypothetical protein